MYIQGPRLFKWKKIEREEFLIGLRENGVELTKPEAEILFNFFDKDRNEIIALTNFWWASTES